MNAPDLPCANCGKPVPAVATNCPSCGRLLAVPPPDSTSDASRPRRTGGWLLFLVALLLPAVLTLLTAKSDDLWPFFTFALGGITAIYCGFWTARLACRTTIARVLVGLIFSAGFYVVSFFLCCAGCTLGGARLNFH